MTSKERKTPPLPTKEEVLEFINGSDKPVGKRELTRAFQVASNLRSEFRALLKEMQKEGLIDRGHKQRMAPKGSLPEVVVIEVVKQDMDGELYAVPTGKQADSADAVKILVRPTQRAGAAPKTGDRLLARLTRIGKAEYEAQPIRVLRPGAQKVLGLLEASHHGCILRPTDRRNSKEYFIPSPDLKDAKPGDLALAEPVPGRSLGAQVARVIERVGSFTDPKAFSLIAIHSHGIPDNFPESVLKDAEKLKPATLGDRTDLRDIPLVTIDGADARDFDDAVWAERDTHEHNEGGWHLLVAIADVSHYVRPNSALDKEALKRGNSVYFPDRVVPMLPERLSNDLCSLRPDEERACLAVHLWISKDGELLRHKFVRGLMRSAARLTYEQVQKAKDGYTDETTGPLLDSVIKPLYGAYEALIAARKDRGTLELDIPERKALINEAGEVEAIVERERLASHKLIEEFMITANVAAAEALESKRQPVMYRVHDQPSLEKIENLRESLGGLGFKLIKGHVLQPHHFTGILQKAEGTAKSHLVSELILRSQAQANYSPENLGHFGLALRRYAHFTSPIRRYADLLVHRALIRGFGLGDGALSDEQAELFEQIGEDISQTERRAATAERDANDRYTTAYLSERVGAEFSGRINGVTRFGLFVTLSETGADGLVPIRSLPYDYYDHDDVHHTLTGRDTGLTFTLGEQVRVQLEEADKITGGMIFSLVEGGNVDRAALSRAKKSRKPSGKKSHKGRPPKRKGKRR